MPHLFVLLIGVKASTGSKSITVKVYFHIFLLVCGLFLGQYYRNYPMLGEAIETFSISNTVGLVGDLSIYNYYCPLNTTILSQPSKKEQLGVFLSMTSPPL